MNAVPVRDADGRISTAVASFSDITEDRARAAALTESEARLREALDAGGMGSWEVDLATRTFRSDDATRALWGLPRREGGDRAEEFAAQIMPEDRALRDARLSHALMTGADYRAEFRIRRADTGELRWIASRGSLRRGPSGGDRRLVGLNFDVTRRKLAEEKSRETAELLQRLLESTPDLVWAKDVDGRITLGNQALFDAIGEGDPARVIGFHARDLFPDADQARTIMENDARIIASGRAEMVEEAVGSGDDRRLYQTVKAPMRDSVGGVVGLVGVSRDVTEAKAAEQRQVLLAREVDHRAKNVLAIVRSIVRLSDTTDPASFARSVEGRVAALARAHGLLSRDFWSGADLHTAIQEELSAFAATNERIELRGPGIRMRPGAVQPLAMVLHELATNAAKYGALSTPAGRIAVTWSTGEPDTAVLRLRWQESGGPPVAGPPDRRGFGSTLIESTVRHQLGGEVTTRWEPEGLCCELTVAPDLFDAVRLARTALDQDQAVAPTPPQAGDLEGKRVLLAEDETLLALEFQRMLEALGCAVLGPAGSLRQAQALSEQGIDAAILDINLRGEPSFPLADRLRTLGVPCIFVSGYGELPRGREGCELLRKPVSADELATSLRRALVVAKSAPAAR